MKSNEMFFQLRFRRLWIYDAGDDDGGGDDHGALAYHVVPKSRQKLVERRVPVPLSTGLHLSPSSGHLPAAAAGSGGERSRAQF